MIDQFKVLTADEYQKLKDAVSLITILIAGADGKFEKQQFEWANKITKIRSYNMKSELKVFYQEVGVDFEEKLVKYVESFPRDIEDRNNIVSDRLSYINPILAKLDPELSSKLYKSFLSFAEHVAKASGGILGFFTINTEEAKWIKLPMLSPVIYNGDEEE